MNTYMEDLLTEATLEEEQLWTVLETNTQPNHHTYHQFMVESKKEEKKDAELVKKWRRGRQNRRNYKNWHDSHDKKVEQLISLKCSLKRDNSILRKENALLQAELEFYRARLSAKTSCLSFRRRSTRSSFRNSICSEADSP